MKMTLTLQEIRDHSPCQTGWKKLTKAVGNDMTTKLSIGDVVISNGLDDALWCFRCLDPRKRVAAIIPAVKRAAVHSKDKRVHDCVKDIEKWLAGDNSIDLLAVESEAWAASEAARTAAWAAWTAWEAAESAAWAAWAAREAARTAAWAAWAARAAAESVARAAWAAWAASESEAESKAESITREAAWAAAESIAESIAGAAARQQQKSDLLKMFPPMILKGETK